MELTTIARQKNAAFLYEVLQGRQIGESAEFAGISIQHGSRILKELSEQKILKRTVKDGVQYELVDSDRAKRFHKVIQDIVWYMYERENENGVEQQNNE